MMHACGRQFYRYRSQRFQGGMFARRTTVINGGEYKEPAAKGNKPLQNIPAQGLG